MLQVRQDGRAFAIDRDITNLFIPLARATAVRLEDEASWPPLVKKLAKTTNLTGASFIPASIALAKFASELNDRESHDFPAAWVNSGMARLPEAVLLLTLFQIGAGTVAAAYSGSRAANRLGYRDANADKLLDLTARIAHTMSADRPSVRGRRRAETRKKDGFTDGQG